MGTDAHQYTANGATLYQGDALEIMAQLPAGTVACIVTDPPYSSGARQEAGKATRGPMCRADRHDDKWFATDNLTTNSFGWFMRQIAFRCYRLAGRRAAAHVFIDWRMYPTLMNAWESAGWSAKNLLVWDKITPGLGANYRSQHELVAYFEKGVAPFQHRRTANVYSVARPRDLPDAHPTRKPVDLLREFIGATTPPGGLVLDPFCGSGTTLRAAIDLGRPALGIEIDPTYYAVAAQEIRQTPLRLADVATLPPDDQRLLPIDGAPAACCENSN
jgi:site-specific DNA-methyltransferase (adenine-specific)